MTIAVSTFMCCRAGWSKYSMYKPNRRESLQLGLLYERPCLVLTIPSELLLMAIIIIIIMH